MWLAVGLVLGFAIYCVSGCSCWFGFVSVVRLTICAGLWISLLGGGVLSCWFDLWRVWGGYVLGILVGALWLLWVG